MPVTKNRIYCYMINNISKGQRKRFGIIDPIFSNDFLEILDGLMLGDAHFEIKGNSARIKLGQRYDRIEWLEQVKQLLEKSSLKCKINNHSPGGLRTIVNVQSFAQPSICLVTSYYPELFQYYLRWYNNNKKQIPENVQISPIALALWYCGDGHLDKGKTINIATDSFQLESIKVLSQKINDHYELETYVSNNNRIIMSHTYDRAKFIQLIQNYIPLCFQYKLKIAETCHIKSELNILRKLVSPDGVVYEFYNIHKFCKKYDLNFKQIRYVLIDKIQSHQGWCKPEHYSIFKLINSDDQIYQFKNQTKFAKEQNLNRILLNRLLNDKMKIYKGWKKI